MAATSDAVQGALSLVMAVVFMMSVFAVLAAVPTVLLMAVNGVVFGGGWTEWWVFLPLLVISGVGAIVGFAEWLKGPKRFG